MGVESVDVCTKSKTVTVQYDPKVIKLQTIKNEISTLKEEIVEVKKTHSHCVKDYETESEKVKETTEVDKPKRGSGFGRSSHFKDRYGKHPNHKKLTRMFKQSRVHSRGDAKK